MSVSVDVAAPAAGRAPLAERMEEFVLALPQRVWALPYTAPVLVAAVTLAGNLAVIQSVWKRMGYGAFDLTIFDQAVRNYSRLQPPRVPVKGAYAGTGVGFLQLGDHFSPINALAAPLYWIWSDVRVLLVLEAALYAAAATVVWAFTRHLLGPVAALVVSFAFGLSWGLQEASAVGYHELDWAVLIIPLALRRLQLGKPRQALAVACCLFLVKEEMGLIVAAFGVLLWLRGERRLGVVAAVAGIVWSALAITVIVPAISGSTNSQYWTYNSLGKNPSQAALHIVEHPLSTLHLLISTSDKQNLLLWLLAVSVGACLLSPITLLAVPPLLLRLLSDTATYSQAKFHYNAPLMGVLLLAGVDGCARLVARIGRTEEPTAAGSPSTAAPPTLSELLKRFWLAAVATVAVLGTQTYALGTLGTAAPPDRVAFVVAAKHAVTMVPRNASVEAESSIAVLLSARTQKLVLAEPGKPHGSDWVVLGVSDPVNWPWTNKHEVEKSRDWYMANGYKQVWASDGVWVLHRTEPLTASVDDVWAVRK